MEKEDAFESKEDILDKYKKNIKMDPIYLSNNNNFVNCIIYTVLYFE